MTTKDKKISLQDILNVLEVEYQIENNRGVNAKNFVDVKPIFEADDNCITWLNPTRKDKNELIKNTKAGLVICDYSVSLDGFKEFNSILLKVNDPRNIFTLILTKFFQTKKQYEPGIHPTAIVSSNAIIHPTAHVGPYCIIGNVEIGARCIILSHVVIHDNVVIGENVKIHEHSNIGSDGFGHIWNEDGDTIVMPHLGKLIIEDNVEILQFVNIDKGTLSNTIIRKGAVLDHYVHIGHNAEIGENSMIAAKAVFCGGSKVGSKSFIGVQAIIIDAMSVGNECVIGAGSVVTKHVPNGEVWTGSPAMNLEKFKLIQSKIKTL